MCNSNIIIIITAVKLWQYSYIRIDSKLYKIKTNDLNTLANPNEKYLRQFPVWFTYLYRTQPGDGSWQANLYDMWHAVSTSNLIHGLTLQAVLPCTYIYL